MLTKVCAFCGFSWVLPSVLNSIPGSHLGHRVTLRSSSPLRLLWAAIIPQACLAFDELLSFEGY